MTTALVEVACPGCGGRTGARIGPVLAEPPAPAGPWTLVRCDGCESIYLSPRPADPAALYVEGYHVHRRIGGISGLVRRAAAAVEALGAARLARPPAAVYEIGCGDGELLAAMARRGFRTSGIEASLSAARRARERGLAIEEGRFDGGRGVAGEYQLVLAAHVFEHLEDPRAFLADLRRILRPMGVALLKLPLAGSLDQMVLGGYSGGLDVPYHLFVPAREVLARLVAEAGLELVSCRADPVPNDWVHGLRKAARAELGLPLPFARPWNPLYALPLLPLSLAGAALGGAGRARVVVRKPA